MLEQQKENGKDREGNETLSILDDKRQYLLDELSELMEQAGENYGPFLMEQLQHRLEFVIQNFNEEVKSLIKSSFKKWKTKDSHLRDLMTGKIDTIPVSSDQPDKEKIEDPSTPNFIKDVEFGPIRHK